MSRLGRLPSLLVPHLRSTTASASHQIALAGDQLTGKSTLCAKLANHFGATSTSVGESFRAVAAKRNMSVGALAHELAKVPLPKMDGEVMEADIVHQLASRLDVQLDADTLQQLLNGPPAIVEGRNPALLATVATEVCGKAEHLMYKLYLVCSPRERALRYLLREYGEGMRDEVNRKLPEDRESEADWTAAIQEGVLPDDDAAMARYTEFMPESVMAEFQENQFRDKDDRARYLAIYGVDYRDGSWYDAIIDTSGETAEVNFSKTIAAMEGSAFVKSHAAASRSESTARPASAEAIVS